MASFKYPELKKAKLSIRLLRIVHNASDSTPLACKIYSFTLAKCPDYVAISYSWGRSLAETEIRLNDHPFRVRNNVASLLREMRRHEKLKWRFFWVDAICINQWDIDERNHQVGIMRNVYATAADVLVWLGTSTPQSSLAMDYVVRQSKAVAGAKPAEKKKYRSEMEKFKDHQRWTDQEGKAFLELCGNGYWKRIWIIQELMNAKHIIVFCGAKNFDWQLLDDIFQSLNSIRVLGQFARYPYGREVLESEAAVIVKEKHLWDHRPAVERDGVCLSTLIERYRYSECTHDLDKVYGLLGLSSDADHVEVDYRKSPEKVFGEVLELVCKRQLIADHMMKAFEKVLLSVFGFHANQQRVLTVDEIIERRNLLVRARQGPAPTGEQNVVRNNFVSHRQATPLSGDPEMQIARPSRYMMSLEYDNHQYNIDGSRRDKPVAENLPIPVITPLDIPNGLNKSQTEDLYRPPSERAQNSSLGPREYLQDGSRRRRGRRRLSVKPPRSESYSDSCPRRRTTSPEHELDMSFTGPPRTYREWLDTPYKTATLTPTDSPEEHNLYEQEDRIRDIEIRLKESVRAGVRAQSVPERDDPEPYTPPSRESLVCGMSMAEAEQLPRLPQPQPERGIRSAIEVMRAEMESERKRIRARYAANKERHQNRSRNQEARSRSRSRSDETT